MNRMIGTEDMAAQGAIMQTACRRFSTEHGWSEASTRVPNEMPLTLYINGQELVTILCTPTKLNCLVLGFLYSQSIISSLEDVASMRMCEDDLMADVRLNNPVDDLPVRRTLTSGCGGGIALNIQGQAIASDLVITPSEIFALTRRLQEQAEMHRLSGGAHTSAVANRNELVVVAEDIGRHNTLDKLIGECLLRRISTQDGIWLTTGRISSDMLLKAAKMKVPILISRTSPTGLAVSLARNLGVTLVGYAQLSRLSVYTHPERVSGI